MTTTLNSIKSAVETLLVGLTPTGEPYSQRKYVKAAESIMWEDRAQSDVDRRFSVRVAPDGPWRSFGTLTEHTADAAMTVTIGHRQGERLQDSEERKDTDVRQIVLELTDPANRPTGVWRMQPVFPAATVQRDGWWQTDIRFSITFSEANP